LRSRYRGGIKEGERQFKRCDWIDLCDSPLVRVSLQLRIFTDSLHAFSRLSNYKTASHTQLRSTCFGVFKISGFTALSVVASVSFVFIILLFLLFPISRFLSLPKYITVFLKFCFVFLFQS
jgi:hypothetical protein